MDWGEVAKNAGGALAVAWIVIKAAIKVYGSAKKEAEEEGRSQTVEAKRQIGGTIAARYTQDLLFQLIGEIREDTKATRKIVEEDQKERDEAEREELRELRRRDAARSRDPHE